MLLFSSERPEVLPGRKALLLDGSAVPHILVMPLDAAACRLTTMLRNYDTHGGYSNYHTDLPMSQLAYFFALYNYSPEATLLKYFGWTAQVPLKATPLASEETIAAAAYVDSLL